MLVKFCTKSIWPYAFVVVKILMTSFISLRKLDLFKWLTLSWFNFCKWYILRKILLLILIIIIINHQYYFRLFNFCELQIFLLCVYDSLDFLSVCCFDPLFIFNFVNLDILYSWLLIILDKGFVNLLDFFKELSLCFINSLHFLFPFCWFQPEFDDF